MKNQFRVMLIDDDNIINILNRRMLEVTMFASEIKIFTKAELALIEIKEHTQLQHSPPPPDLIFLDINMPEMDGWEFLDELLLLPPDTIKNCKIILLSSSIDLADIEKSVSYPFVANFISKPLTPDKLLSINSKDKSDFLFEVID